MRTLALLAAAAVTPAFGAIDFRQDIEPIFRQHCWECHGPSQQNGSLRLDRKASALVGGNRVDIVAGLPERSRVYRRITGMDRPSMPPETPLSTPEINKIKQWIEEGAEWPDDPPEVTWDVDPAIAPLLADIRAGNFEPVRAAVTANPGLALARNGQGVSLLREAALYSGPDEVAWLLAHKSEVDAADRSGLTPLMVAIEDPEKVGLLLEAKADPNLHSASGRTALLNAVDRKRSAAVVKLLLEHGALSAREPGQSDPLLEVTRNGDIESMKLLLAALGGKFPREATGQAALSNCMACLEMVLAQEPTKQALSESLLEAAIMARTNMLAALIAAGADVNARDKEGKTALIKVAYSDYTDEPRLQLLLDHGADVNAKDSEGDTALKEARKKGSTKIVAMLIAAGAKE